MKTNRFTPRLAIALGLAASAGFAESSAPPAPNRVQTASLAPSLALIHIAVATSPDVAADQWAGIKDTTYDMRDHFFAGLQRLEARVDDQIAELSARRAAMTSATNTREWDFAMKEMVDARSYLKSTGEELHQATVETWGQLKDRVGQAWVRTQEAYGKVKASTTS